MKDIICVRCVAIYIICFGNCSLTFSMLRDNHIELKTICNDPVKQYAVGQLDCADVLLTFVQFFYALVTDGGNRSLHS